MRRLVLAAMMVGVAHGALAADLPDLPVLRGFMSDAPRSARTNWEGFYVGGQAAYGSSQMDFTNATSSVAAQLLFGTAMESEQHVSGWPILGQDSLHGRGFGGFVGYNAQWDDAVIGVEANYIHGSFGGSQTGSMTRIFTLSNGYTDTVTNEGTASILARESGTVRIRGGYAWGCFLPYAFGGVAFGLADIVRTSHVFGTQVNASAAPGFQFIPFDLSASAVQNNHLLWGYSFGGGVDVMLIGGLFARGEFEYTKYAAPINTSVSTVRGGVGYKF